MRPSFEIPLNDFAARLSIVRTSATFGVALAARDAQAIMRTAAYVYTAAAVETFVKATIVGLLNELNALAVPRKTVRPSLFALLADDVFDSIKSKRKFPGIERRIGLLDSLFDSASASFNSATLPLDGSKTIRPVHIDTVWRVFGIPGFSFPSSRERLALESLADTRNELAHGSLEPAAFGRTKTAADIKTLIDTAENIGLHISEAFDAYLDAGTHNR